jgi:hypothetical protein
LLYSFTTSRAWNDITPLNGANRSGLTDKLRANNLREKLENSGKLRKTQVKLKSISGWVQLLSKAIDELWEGVHRR